MRKYTCEIFEYKQKLSRFVHAVVPVCFLGRS